MSLIRLALPKGSLQTSTIELFKDAGWIIGTSSRSYFPTIDDPHIECALVRAQEASRYVESGLFDLASNHTFRYEQELQEQSDGWVEIRPRVVPLSDRPIGGNLADVKRKGRDLTIVSNGIMVHKSIAVANRLAEEGIEVEVVDLRTMVPMDKQAIIDSVTRTGKLLVVHEACETAGWAGEVMAVVSSSRAFDYLDAPMRRLTGKNVPIPYNRVLERAAVPQEEDIEREIRAILKGEY